MDSVQAMDEHWMMPGSHERGTGPECRCGWGWDRWNDVCISQDERGLIGKGANDG